MAGSRSDTIYGEVQTKMRRRFVVLLPALFAATALFLSPVGCTQPKPRGIQRTISPLDFQFDTIWVSILDAVQDEGYHIDKASKRGEDGIIVTLFKKYREDLVGGEEFSTRIAARITRVGKDYALHVTASRFTRSRGEFNWTWQGEDEEIERLLLARFEKNIEKKFRHKSRSPE